MNQSSGLGPAVEEPRSFVVACVPGVTPTSWSRTWAQRKPELSLELRYLTQVEAAQSLADGLIQAAFLRNPIDRDLFHAIPLYTEVTVVVMPADHTLTAAEALEPADLAGERLFRFPDDPLDWRETREDSAFDSIRPQEPGAANLTEAIALVAAGSGLAIAPLSLARLHARKDLSHRELSGAPHATMSLAWLAPETSSDMDDFIGVIRGRTVNSTRGTTKASSGAPSTAAPAPTKPSPKKPRPTTPRKSQSPSATRGRSGKDNRRSRRG